MVDAIIVQVIGLLGVASIVISFQQNRRSTILLWLIIGQIFFAIHFGLLGGWTGVALNLLAIARGIAFYFKPLYRWAQTNSWMYLFLILCWLGGILTWEGYRSLFVVLAMSIETIGVWRNSPKEIRWFMLGVRPIYFAYALSIASYAGMLADILFSISLVVSMYRHDTTERR